MTVADARTPRPDESALLASLPQGQFIRGEWRTDRSAAGFAVYDPATRAPLADVAVASAADGRAALGAALAAQPAMARTSPRERADVLWRAYDALVDRAAEFALLITLEMGKPLAEADAEVAYAADFLRWYAEEASRPAGEYRTLPDGTSRMLVTPRPVGPCLLITPWNFPIAMATRKIAPAIAAGCASIVKPAAETPLTTLLFAELLAGAGLPEGGLNVLTTDDPGPLVSALLGDGRIRKLSFTGSTEVGKLLLRQAADNVLRCSMELGGNAPFIVFEDADPVAAADGFMVAKLRNGGEACTAANRLYVHRAVAGQFREELARKLAGVRIGRGTEPATTLGPLINETEHGRIDAWVEAAVGSGAQVLAEGPAAPEGGHFMSPKVLVDVPEDSPVAREEIFGPVIGMRTFDGEDEVVGLANATRYGLVAYAYTRDVQRSMRLCERLEFGMVGLNRGIVSNAAAPFGGIKQSGLGREGSHEGLREYQEFVYAALNA